MLILLGGALTSRYDLWDIRQLGELTRAQGCFERALQLATEIEARVAALHGLSGTLTRLLRITVVTPEILDLPIDLLEQALVEAGDNRSLVAAAGRALGSALVRRSDSTRRRPHDLSRAIHLLDRVATADPGGFAPPAGTPGRPSPRLCAEGIRGAGIPLIGIGRSTPTGRASPPRWRRTSPTRWGRPRTGTIRFHDWIGDSWAVLFSHPRNFTPVCTTELGYLAKIKPEFDRRDVKIIGLSVDPVENHEKWASDIAETQGAAPNYPLIGDADFTVSKLYGMLPADTSGDSDPAHPGPEPDRAHRVRHRPGQEDQAHPRLPDDDRPQLRRGAPGDRLAAAHRRAPRRHTGQLAAGRRRHHRRIGLRRRGPHHLAAGLGRPPPLHPDRAPALTTTASGPGRPPAAACDRSPRT